jgi:molecular chaperone Hsp33
VDRDGSVLASGGFILQLLAGADEEMITQLEERISAMDSVTDRIQSGATPEDLLREVVGEEVQVLQRQPVSFDCSCSPERIRSLLKSMGKEEISDILKSRGEAEVVCHFCNERYVVEKAELEEWLGETE